MIHGAGQGLLFDGALLSSTGGALRCYSQLGERLLRRIMMV